MGVTLSMRLMEEVRPMPPSPLVLKMELVENLLWLVFIMTELECRPFPTPKWVALCPAFSLAPVYAYWLNMGLWERCKLKPTGLSGESDLFGIISSSTWTRSSESFCRSRAVVCSLSNLLVIISWISSSELFCKGKPSGWPEIWFWTSRTISCVGSAGMWWSLLLCCCS